MNSKYLFILLLALFSISFSSLVWTIPLSISSQKVNAVTSRPVVFENSLILTSQEGFVYAISPSSGSSMWSKQVGSYPRQPVVHGDAVIVANSNGSVFAFKKGGILKWNISLGTYVYGMTSGDLVYVTTKKGLLSIDKAGNVGLVLNLSGGFFTSPVTDGKRIIFGFNDTLVSVKPNKQLEWAKEVSNFWESNPVISDGMVFIGALDNNLYAFDAADGFYRWKAETKGWILSTPYVKNGNVYFGSNDGFIYSVGEFDGKLRWKVPTKEAVQSSPVLGSFGDKDILFAGSNDNNLYAVDDSSGTLLWKQPAKDWVHSPIIIGKSVIFGSHDGTVYSVSTERACTIESPDQDSLVGYKETLVTGRAFSEYGDSLAYLRVNNGDWVSLDVLNESWSYVLDPNLYEFGIINIECKIGDQLGEEHQPYTLLSLTRTENVPKEQFNVIFPESVQEGKDFNITVLDENKKPVLNFHATFQGKTYSGNGVVTIKAMAGGKSQQLVVSKPGFNDSSVYITVSTSTEFVWVGLGALLVLGLIVFVYYTRIMKK